MCTAATARSDRLAEWVRSANSDGRSNVGSYASNWIVKVMRHRSQPNTMTRSPTALETRLGITASRASVRVHARAAKKRPCSGHSSEGELPLLLRSYKKRGPASPATTAPALTRTRHVGTGASFLLRSKHRDSSNAPTAQHASRSISFVIEEAIPDDMAKASRTVQKVPTNESSRCRPCWWSPATAGVAPKSCECSPSRAGKRWPNAWKDRAHDEWRYKGVVNMDAPDDLTLRSRCD